MKVTWIVQSNLGSSEDAMRIFRACSKLNMTFVGQPVIPFSKKTADHHTDLPTVFYGATNWIDSVYKQNDWSPGVFFNPESVCSFWFKKYRKNALNYGARFTTFSEVVRNYDSEIEAARELFVRPDGDNKDFPGRVMTLDEVKRWEETMSGDSLAIQAAHPDNGDLRHRCGVEALSGGWGSILR